jgi:membrane associated rhomboid family serine protease
MTHKTVGVDPKVPVQAVVAIIAWAVAHFAGIDLSPEAEAAIAAVLGIVAGVLAPAPNVVTATRRETP